MRSFSIFCFATCLWVQAQAQRHSQIWERATTVAAPECSLTCLMTLVPKYCGSLTNAACICTSTELAAALTTCALAACNITEALQLERYSAETCGVENDKSRYYEQIHLYCVLAPLATLFVAARIFTRTKLDIGLGPDDWMMAAALAAYLTDVGTGSMIAAQGFGEHTFWLSTSEVSSALKFFYISELFYLLAITLTKLSLLLFFRRIFPDRNFRIATIVMGIFVVVSNFSLAMALCFQCIPLYGIWTNWMYKVAPVKCINVYACVYVAAGMSIFHDLIILSMPLPTLWSLNLHWKKKAHLVVMFSVGSFVVVCSALRLPTLMKLEGSSDPSYDQAPIAVWTNLEISVGIICACLPATRSLVGYIFPSLKMTLGASATGGTPAYPANSSSGNKFSSRKGPLTSTKSFIELDDRIGGQGALENGRKRAGTNQSGRSWCGDADGASMGSETPIREKFVPGGYGEGHQATVGVGGGLGHGNGSGSRDKAIIMTRTFQQSERRLQASDN
ncbi:uncharacterized protein PAC_20103 [Phialocephala subalpina]|uniref:Uncharacterized protein n=1 Tax=Phialocephala subalpina TaxID=576137 RepID=A0A1L7XYQ5_9HELO|nr:uncharacterized protein PAC_20103 [Phialocephala subalpina]